MIIPSHSAARFGRGLIVCGAALAGLAACEGNANGVPTPAQSSIADLSLSPDSIFLVAGQPRQFEISAVGANGLPLSNFKATWSSSNRSVATVDAAGVVRRAGPGRAIITATAGGQTAEGIVGAQ
ncbi:MAG TPA: Ig-like domain-containing protein [Longimicrobium sp.]|uniref:Ig-like domain-containing protein n=1 Tax=Longimicrobium sp. TaxID=2029185 RepID=UPI002EDAF27E